jgi:hypothetical protein
MSMYIDIYIEMPECRTVRNQVSPVPELKKTYDAETGPVPD